MWAGMDELDTGDHPNHAQAQWWTTEAASYLEEHTNVLGTSDFVWGPEGLSEADAHLLGDVTGLRILEFGAGAAQCSRYLQEQGADVVATDISEGMLTAGRAIDIERGRFLPLAVADATKLPFADNTFDVAFTSFGALAFIADLHSVFAECARVLRPGGLLAYSAPHPVRWMFPDSPYARDMTVTTPYFSRTPYVERDDSGHLVYSEHHHTLADHAEALRDTGFVMTDIREPEWPADRTIVWGAWGPERSPWIPGTLIVCARTMRGECA